MNINPNTWYAVWFLWCCKVLDKAWPNRTLDPRVDLYQQGTNLCHFLRTLMLGTLVAFMAAALWCFTIITCVVMPFYLFGISAVYALSVILIIFAFVGLLLWLVLVVAPQAYASAKTSIEQYSDKVLHVAQDQTPGFIKLLVNHAVAVKQRYCPTIRFNKETKL